jgi:hypothetical protein
VVFAVLAQFGALAVDLVAAHEVQPLAKASVRMSMASWPLVRKTTSSGRPMTTDFTGSPMCLAGIHSRAPISERVPGAFPHVRQVHSVDPVGHLAHAAQVLPLDAGHLYLEPSLSMLCLTRTSAALTCSRMVFSQ